MRRRLAALALAPLLAVLAACSGGEPPTPEAASTPAPTATPTPEATSTPAPTATPTPEATSTPAATPEATAEPTAALPASFGDGEHRVGVDITPGLYRAASPTDECEWERRAAGDAPGGAVTGFGDASFPMHIVLIAAPDSAFASSGCGTWTSDLAPLLTPGEAFGDGAWFVGPEIAPGRYRASSPTDDCSWWRLQRFDDAYDRSAPYNDFGHTGYRHSYGGLHPNSAGRSDRDLRLTIADIASPDRAFVSDGCGTWTADLTPRVAPGQPFGAGTFLVGPEIAPGRYYASGVSCVWFRLDDFSGERSWGHGASLRYHGYYRIADIDPADAGFTSGGGCGTWSRELTPIVRPGEPFGEGAYIVGPEIAPGRYRTSSPGWGCSWYRLSGFGGFYWDHSADIIGFGSGSQFPLTIVDIEPSDAGFYSRGCGAWSTDLTPLATPGEPFGDGTFLVGPEIAPGLYRTIAPAPYGCTWMVLREDDYSGEEWVYPRGDDGIVEISAADRAFASTGCGVWSNDETPRIAPGQPFGDGAWLVGSEIAPGSYRTDSALDSCWWTRSTESERYSESGSEHTVDIDAADAWFVSGGCGVWTPAP